MVGIDITMYACHAQLDFTVMLEKYMHVSQVTLLYRQDQRRHLSAMVIYLKVSNMMIISLYISTSCNLQCWGEWLL